ncbi:hypothetical protein TNCV_3701521 [Trichonephila clavipes]|nr:hypothetical protein TNCV_3701521 [Trichonephila clavipes]
MAEGDDDAFFSALENLCKIIKSALLSKCNMNQQMREEARQALAAENYNSDDVRKLFKAQINPRIEKIGIRHVKEISDNRIIVNCASEKDRHKLMTTIEANPKFLKPTVP